MSINIVLDDQPEFYTNLDLVHGRVVLSLVRPETIGAIVVKLEGESKTALVVSPLTANGERITRPGENDGNVATENHKLLYKVQQVFPDETVSAAAGPFSLQPGRHEFPFRFKMPFNNACSDPNAMARLGGIANAGTFNVGGGPAFLGFAGIRVMDGTRQLMYQHVTRTLPPLLTGYPGEAEIRYYVKVTVQRPGIFKENWRYAVGLRFMPLEPPRPARTGQEAYARRPFAFQPRAALSTFPGGDSKRKMPSTFGFGQKSYPVTTDRPVNATPPPVVEMSARLPHPAILTCNQPIPLRLLAKKRGEPLPPTSTGAAGGSINDVDDVFLVSLQVDLIGRTHIRASYDASHTRTNRWVVVSEPNLSIPVCSASAPQGSEVVVPDYLWSHRPLPNTVAPSFVTCNISRTYEVEVKIGLSWGRPVAAAGKGGKSAAPWELPQTIFLPLHFSKVEVYSGVAPPQRLLDAMAAREHIQQQSVPGAVTISGPPRLPRRPSQPNNSGSNTAVGVPQQHHHQPAVVHDPLYPPQLAPGQSPYTDPDTPPPSYDEAIADSMPAIGTNPGERPAYSGVTNENSPASFPDR